MVIGPDNKLSDYTGRLKYTVGPIIEDYKWYEVSVSQTRIPGTPKYNFVVKINGKEVKNVVNYHAVEMKNVDLWSISPKANVSIQTSYLIIFFHLNKNFQMRFSKTIISG